MEGDKMYEGENTDDSIYSDADLTSHLRDKIRQQAGRLRTLEQYRLLCETKILELVPNHPIPIKKEHLGSSSPLTGNITKLNHELSIAQDKIARLENQLSQKSMDLNEPKDYLILLEKYNDLLKDKNDLEESLRAEMQNCEEQKAYIDMLKQTIDGKREDYDGMSLDPKSMNLLNSSRSKNDDSKRESNRMKNAILDYESQIKRLQNALRGKDSENEVLVRERSELDSHLRQAAEALQIAEEEVAKLEEEKNQLFEYVEQNRDKEQDLERELNDLTRYFEEMKKDFHETLTSLEVYKATQTKQEAEIDIYKEELQKTSQIIRENQENYENLKKLISEKETLIRVLKEEKTNAEIRIEKLQSNVEALSESLKETQMDTSRLQDHLDSISKNDYQKSENLNKLKNENTSLCQENQILKEKLGLLQKDIETEKKSKSEFEKIRENDMKTTQELKAKILDLQAKCEILEGMKRTRSDNDVNRKNDIIKITQLEEELEYINNTNREIQQREALQNQALIEAKTINIKLTESIEELCIENETLKAEISKKTKDLELYLSKFSHLNEFCQTIEADKNELEESLQTERSSTKNLKDQVQNDKQRVEELEKTVLENAKIREKLEKNLQEKEEELKNAKNQTKAVEKELEEEKSVKSKGNSEIRDLYNKIQIQEYEIDKLNTEIANCCKTISSFCGKFTISYNDHRSCVSIKYKDYLDKWKEGSASNIICVTNWVNWTIEELESLSKTLFNSNKQLKNVTSEFQKVQIRYEEANSGEVIYKQHALKLKNELDELYQKNEIILEKSEEEINNLRYEVNNLKREVVSLSNEKFSLNEALKNTTNEYQSLKYSNELSRKIPRIPDYLNTEKRVYSKEMMLEQVRKDLGITENPKISTETMRIKGEYEGDNESVREKIRKNVICTQDHSASTCPYLHISEKSMSSKSKSQFS
ncbi:hypothetical protein SteCoe_30819 [Stentor coeruleus]|uniref:Uncharacterized protein n=1 Tax=Stentor coeruleus TaxID=5963 RepID=A0A1R2B2P4_9CILI|nr:hypothetical protein SteCoe_30819 [Stentor coeruleus]